MLSVFTRKISCAKILTKQPIEIVASKAPDFKAGKALKMQ